MGSYRLRFATPARETLDLLDGSPQYAAKLRKVRRALGLRQVNPRHPGLHSHQYENFPGAPKAKVWDSYVENRTPGAWRIWWMYGPDEVCGDQAAGQVPPAGRGGDGSAYQRDVGLSD